MSTSADPNPKQNGLSSQCGQAMPATTELNIDKIKNWNQNELFECIRQNLAIPLDDEDKESFFKSKIDGQAFLDLAGDRDYFRSVGISPGASQKLAQVAKNLVKLVKDTICRKSEYCPLHHTLHATA